jgi:hypothetical protein
MERMWKIIIFITLVVIIALIAFSNYRQAAFLSFSSSNIASSDKSASSVVSKTTNPPLSTNAQENSFSSTENSAVHTECSSDGKCVTAQGSGTDACASDDQCKQALNECSSGDSSCEQIQPACTDECLSLGQKECFENGYRICVNRDEDSCLDWSEVTHCETSCLNGACSADENPATVSNDETIPEDSSDEEQQTSVCTDSDKGRNLYQRGKTEQAGQTFTDFCWNSDMESVSHGVCVGSAQEGCVLVEYSCKNNQVEKEELNCPAGYECNLGACIRTSETHNLCVEEEGSYACRSVMGPGENACLLDSECQKVKKTTSPSFLSALRNFFGI